MQYVKDYAGINKTTIYNRILEWSATNFGSLGSVLHYENPETGKIILKGRININYLYEYKSFWGVEKDWVGSSECTQTMVFTVIDGKLKIELSNLEYIWSYLPDGFLSTPVTVSSSLFELYPITNGEPSTWRGKISLLKETDNKIDFLILLLDNYIRGHVEDYIF